VPALNLRQHIFNQLYLRLQHGGAKYYAGGIRKGNRKLLDRLRHWAGKLSGNEANVERSRGLRPGSATCSGVPAEKTFRRSPQRARGI